MQSKKLTEFGKTQDDLKELKNRLEQAVRRTKELVCFDKYGYGSDGGKATLDSIDACIAETVRTTDKERVDAYLVWLGQGSRGTREVQERSAVKTSARALPRRSRVVAERKKQVYEEQSHGHGRPPPGSRTRRIEGKTEEQKKCVEMNTVVRHIQGRVRGGSKGSVARLMREMRKDSLYKGGIISTLERVRQEARLKRAKRKGRLYKEAVIGALKRLRRRARLKRAERKGSLCKKAIVSAPKRLRRRGVVLARMKPVRGGQRHGRRQALLGSRRKRTERRAEEQKKCLEVDRTVRQIRGRLRGDRRRNVARLRRERRRNGV